MSVTVTSGYVAHESDVVDSYKNPFFNTFLSVEHEILIVQKNTFFTIP